MRRFWIGVLVVTALAGPAVQAGPAAAAPAPQRPTQLAIGPPGEIAIMEGGYITTQDGWTTIPWDSNEDYNLVDNNYWQRKFFMGSTPNGCSSLPPSPSGRICYKVFAPGSGTEYRRIDLAGIVYDSFCVALNDNNRAEVFAKAGGKDAVHIWQTQDNIDTWGSGWQTLGGLIANFNGVWCRPWWQTMDDHRLAIRVWGDDNQWHYKAQITPHGSWPSNWS